jgi:hypothetical protein
MVTAKATATAANSYNSIGSLRLQIIADMVTIGFTDAYATINAGTETITN